MKRHFAIIFIFAVSLMALPGCTYWRQLTTPPTWGMSLPELWQYERVQAEQLKLSNPTIELTDSITRQPLSDAQVTAIPRPGLTPIGRPRTKRYVANSAGIVTLKELPSGAESWITIDGFTSVPLAGLLDDGHINAGDVLIDLVDNTDPEQE